jgi:hypothetical protein
LPEEKLLKKEQQLIKRYRFLRNNTLSRLVVERTIIIQTQFKCQFTANINSGWQIEEIRTSL